MPSTDSPPGYYGTTTVSEKPLAVPEKTAKSATYHITLQRCKRTVKQPGGRLSVHGFIEDHNYAITISPCEDWPAVRTRIFGLFRSAWPDLMSDANSTNYSISICVQYSTQDGDVYGRISMLALDDGFWNFVQRNDVHIINLIAASAPRSKDAPGEINYSAKTALVRGVEISKDRCTTKKKEVIKHLCVLQ